MNSFIWIQTLLATSSLTPSFLAHVFLPDPLSFPLVLSLVSGKYLVPRSLKHLTDNHKLTALRLRSGFFYWLASIEFCAL